MGVGVGECTGRQFLTFIDVGYRFLLQVMKHMYMHHANN